MAPHVFRGTVGLIAVGTRRYIDWFAALERCVSRLRDFDRSNPTFQTPIDTWHFLVGP